jgi:hypothetical protein
LAEPNPSLFSARFEDVGNGLGGDGGGRETTIERKGQDSTVGEIQYLLTQELKLLFCLCLEDDYADQLIGIR